MRMTYGPQRRRCNGGMTLHESPYPYLPHPELRRVLIEKIETRQLSQDAASHAHPSPT